MADRNLQSDPASRDHKNPISAASVATMLTGDGATSSGGGPLLFEISTEVCNQVGGIYQVIRSKAPLMVQRWGDGYCLIGPWEGAKAQVEFEELPASGWLAHALDELRSAGLHVHHGRWMVPGRPRVLLIEHWQGWERLNEAKFRLWTDHGIDTPGDDGLVNFVVSFADAVRRVFEVLCRHRDSAGAGGSAPWSPTSMSGSPALRFR